MITKEQINKIVSSIAKNFATKKIFLFGSYAHGEPNNDSDLDICVIADIGAERKINIIRNIRREISREFNNPMDIILYDEKEFNERAILKNTFEYSISKNGILING